MNIYYITRRELFMVKPYLPYLFISNNLKVIYI